jgi:uncharacterized protein DUF6600
MVKFVKTAILGIALVLFSTGWSMPARAADVSFDFFYSNLSPHGSWLVSGEYGQVWQPRVYAADWNPYYDGHWVYTDLGWAWVSDYSWGAIPYHYGTWVMEADYGWVWVPGYVWAPAWVVFRTGPDYIGWAPVSPRYSLSLSMSFGQPVSGPFVFVSARDFVAPRLRSCVIPEGQTRVIIENTRIVNSLTIENSVVVNRGPSPRLIERASGRPIREARIEEVRGVAPEPHVDRANLRVDPQRMRQGLRVAEPTRQEQQQPGAPRHDSTEGIQRNGLGQNGSQPSHHPADTTPRPTTPRQRPERMSPESPAPRTNPHGQSRGSVAPQIDPHGQSRQSMAPRTNPHGRPNETLTPRTAGPHGQPGELSKPSGKSGKPLPPKGSDTSKDKKSSTKKPPKKDSEHQTGHPDAQ